MSSSGDNSGRIKMSPVERPEEGKRQTQEAPVQASQIFKSSKAKSFKWKPFEPPTLGKHGHDTNEGRYDNGEQVTPALEFINISNCLATPGNHHEHRKVVRRHVMRNYHGWKKEDIKLPGEQPRTLQNRRLESAVQPKFVLPISKSSRSEVRPQQNDNIRQGTANSSNISIVSSNSSATNQDLNFGVSHEFRVSTPAWMSADPVVPPVREFLHQFDSWLYDTTVPFALVQSEDAPILYITSRNWPFPQPLGSFTPRTSIWMPDVKIPPPKVQPRSCMHKSILVHPAICATKEYCAFKVDTIRWIEKRLPDASKGTNDATIGSILLLTTLESARGNVTESVYHMNGLAKIINLRGGIQGFVGRSHFLIKIFLLDLIVAILSNKEPVLGTLPTLLPPNILGPKQHVVSGSPLFCCGALKLGIDEQSFCQQSKILLQHMQDLTILASADTESLIMREAIRKYIVTLRTRQSSPPTIVRIIHLTATIYERALRQTPIAFSSSVNRELARELCHALESPVHDNIWHQFPGILIWILLTTSAAIDRSGPGCGFSVSLLTKVALGAGYGWWEDMTLAMRAFLKIKIRAEGILVTE